MTKHRMKASEAERLRLLIREMTKQSMIYRVLRDELRQIGRWRNAPRGSVSGIVAGAKVEGESVQLVGQDDEVCA